MTFNFEAGVSLPARNSVTITRTDIVRYQGASGDFDAAHHDDAHAQSFGYQGAFSLGMLHAGALAAWISEFAQPGAVRGFKVKFRGVAFPGDQLSYEGVVTDVIESGAQRLAKVSLACIRSNGDRIVEAVADVAI